MGQLQGFPYFEVQFSKEGVASDRAEVNTLLSHVTNGKPADLIVISHGWNNDMAEARKLYERFLLEVRARLNAGTNYGVAGRKFSILAVLWPSKKFTEQELIAGGAAGTGGIHDDAIKKQLENLKGFFLTQRTLTRSSTRQ